MRREGSSDDMANSKGMSRRAFLKLAAMAGLLVGCGQTKKLLTPTNPPQPTAAPTPSPTTAATAVPAATATTAPTTAPAATPASAPSAGLSRVVYTHHAGVWEGDALAPQALRQMLDTSISALTGLDDAAAAWASLFDPAELIAIKVNTIEGSEVFTHVPLAMAVAECLQGAGVPAEQIIIFDRADRELTKAGFPINRDGPGVRCYGTGGSANQGSYTSGWTLVGSDIRLSDILLQCDALINVPVLKSHSMAGMSFSMKNHYGTFDRPWNYHFGEAIEHGIPELNALPPIRERSRLIVGDVLSASLMPRSGYPSWTTDMIGDAVLLGFDPVAVDTSALQIFTELSPDYARQADRLASPWLAHGVELGLGTNDPQKIDFVEVNLT